MLFKRSLQQELIATATGAFFILLGIVVAQRAGYLIQLAAKAILPNDAIGTLLVFNLVRFLPMLLSLTVFLAVLLTLSRWYRDSEMVIWFGAGLNSKDWIKPVLQVALPAIVVIAILSLFVMPWANQQAESYKVQLENRDDLSTITPGVFKESKHADRVFFIESFDQLGKVVKNVFVQTKQHQKLGIIVAAQGSRESTPNGDQFLVMQNGRRYQGVPNSAEFSTTRFEQYAIRVEAAEAMQKPPPSIQTKSSQELLATRDATGLAEFQWRLAMPVSALILALLAIPLSALDPRAGRSANFVMALLIYMIYYNTLNFMQALVTQGKLSAIIGLWPVHLFFALLAVYFFHRKSNQSLGTLATIQLMLSPFKRAFAGRKRA